MAETVSDRIRLVRGLLSQEQFATRLSVHKNTVGNYERGDREPDAAFCLAIREGFGVSIDWLLTGEGSMRAGAEPTTAPSPAEGAPERDSDLYGRVLEAISAVYKEVGWAISLRQLGAEAAQIADDIAAEGLAPEDKPPAVKAAAAMLRRQLRTAAANPTSEASTKGRA